MTDDIVTRLRKGNFDCLHGKEVDVFHLTIDAADEIERLRAELQSEKNTCRNWVNVAELMLPYVMEASKFKGQFAPYVMTQFTQQAVRGD